MFGFIGYQTTKTEDEEEDEELNLAQQLVEQLEEVLEALEATNELVPRFQEAAEDMDLEGRCSRLKAHLKNLGDSPSEELFEEDLMLFQPLLTDMTNFFRTLQDARLAPYHCWERWLQKPTGKYSRRLGRLNDKLNDRIADHVLCVNIHLPSSECRHGFPPTMEQMKLTRPSEPPTEEETAADLAKQKLLMRRTDSSSFSTQRTSMSSNISWSSTTTCGSTATPRLSLPTQLSMDASMRSVSSLQSRVSQREGGHNYWMDASFVTTNSAFGQDDSVNKIRWDFSPRVVKQDKWWGSSNSNVTKTRKDRINLYIKTQVLRDMPQDTPVKELRIVLAQLEAGDTSPGVQAGKAAMMAIGTLGALVMVSPLTLLGGLSAKEAVTQTPLEAAAVFSHYLIEFELQDGTIGTLENCVEDIYLYGGRSCRKEQHCVARVPLTPGCIGSPDSLDRPITLGDLVRFRNEQRRRPYKLWDNNCKHFCFIALTSGSLFPRASNYQEESLDVFFALCQGCYVQKEEFAIFTESHSGGNAALARQIMTLWEQDGLDISSASNYSSYEDDGEELEEHEEEDDDDQTESEQDQDDVKEEEERISQDRRGEDQDLPALTPVTVEAC